MVLDVVRHAGVDSHSRSVGLILLVVERLSLADQQVGKNDTLSGRTESYSSLALLFSNCFYSSFDLTSLAVRRVKSRKNTQELAFYLSHFYGKI